MMNRALELLSAVSLVAFFAGCETEVYEPKPENIGPDAAREEASLPDSGPDVAPDTQPDTGHSEAEAGQGDAAPECTEHSACDSGSQCVEGKCEVCPDPQVPECEGGGIIDHPYGNGCIQKLCCLSGQDYDPDKGICYDVPLLAVAMCPWVRVYDCYIKMIADAAGATFTTPFEPGVGAFAVTNEGRAPMQVTSIGLTASTSPEISILTSPLPTVIQPGEVSVIQFSYTPQTDERDLGEFFMTTDASNGKLNVPIIADTWWTPCTDATVKDACIPGQFCDEAAGPGTCNECMQPQDPMCTGGKTIALEPEGSYFCVRFVCQCPAGSVYVMQKGCVKAKPCDQACQNCQELCPQFPSSECKPEDLVEHCAD